LPKPDPRELVAVFVGGAAGGTLRVGLSQAFPTADGSWPWTIFAINLSGALLLGYLVTHLRERRPESTYGRPLLATGFCGAYTTFSTMQLELLRMLQRDRYGLALGYAAASIACGLLAAYAGTTLARRQRELA
jgi:CrcB protein